ncbi:transcriptional regulator, BadM/Rrf2 family [Chthonomonas calidirosea]|uniref:Transcriptional regulator, BadM/Rrf2 family n=1 Tax=Chthonomonas calidirosea (strain DSM 23976 / ICMP 18418 / T49) TaxID=1303518 RepID=S0ESR9_CHTCT|nr:Rrf2 family transcriptional regulator [Chthonomonas calidirosea]CCW34010.1 transcriptional regulator, BadM/Rrf2 family [Chthonomonas calidirosea T49]CEK14892.1 transcriptional regulator, BadM/Rrf2 family [Chthonomonas calidirosea]CEK14893.1 transcriptional regulator, BadM/Rrf2 family [Chthonomonas calidirosea]CEK16019.1 transcriptional regulator, BadM/Rrf2 family [Chthonomonas calidirosea]
MSFFNAKLRYGLCAAVDLAMQPPSRACQSREIAARQNIPGPYLDQILAALKGAGIVRSIRGAGGGYVLAKPADKITVGDVVCALLRTDRLFAGPEEPIANAPSIAWVVHEFEEQVEEAISNILYSTTLADLVIRKQSLDDALSIMPGI